MNMKLVIIFDPLLMQELTIPLSVGVILNSPIVWIVHVKHFFCLMENKPSDFSYLTRPVLKFFRLKLFSVSDIPVCTFIHYSVYLLRVIDMAITCETNQVGKKGDIVSNTKLCKHYVPQSNVLVYVLRKIDGNRLSTIEKIVVSFQ